jgi:hypothetical protein
MYRILPEQPQTQGLLVAGPDRLQLMSSTEPQASTSLNGGRSEAVSLLWTSGWDSTYRLLYLLLVRKQPVQPYYLIDPDRLSTGVELQTMKRIKARLASLHPEAKALLRPVIFSDIYDLAANRELTESFERLRAAHGIGSQYDWLARFTTERGLDALEMSVHADDRVYPLLEPIVVSVDQDIEASLHVGRQFGGSDAFNVFRNFRFPRFGLTKLDMERLSSEYGFNQLLELSWFCHSPRSNGTPCGLCNPCASTMEEGMGRRIPAASRARYHARKYLRAIKRLLRHGVHGG